MGLMKPTPGANRGRIPIASKSAKGRSVPLTAELLVNMYAEAAPEGSRNSVVGIGCPGLSVFSPISTAWGDYIRGLYYVPSNNTLWCVVGLTLYKISSAGTASSIGTIGGYGRVSMADNGTQLIIVAGSIAYVVTLASDTLTAITDSDFPNADTVAFLKGYFVFNNNQSGSKGQIFWSSLYGGGAYDALDFATAESLSDNNVAVWRDHDRVLVFGTHTTESWFASGDVDAVFAPIPGSTINRGLGARWSVANVDNRVLFLDSEGVVRVADSVGTRVSTHAIEYEIAQGNWRHDDANSYDGAVASSYIEEGHEFYVLTVPGTGTFVYDAATGLWHKRKSRELEHSRASFHVHAFGKVICGDTETGKLYEQSLSYYDEAGEYLISEIQFPQIHNNGDRFRVHEVELFVETGVGLSDAEINDAYGAIVGSCNILGEWSTQTSAADSAWSGITYGDKFVAVGGSSSPNVQYSSDGETWAGATAYKYGLSAFDYSDSHKGDFYSSQGIQSVSTIGITDDGVRLYYAWQSGGDKKIYEYTLSTPFDLDSAVLADSTDFASYVSAFVTVIFVTYDGQYVYVCEGSDVNRFTLSTPYDVSTFSAASRINTTLPTSPSLQHMIISEDGSKLIGSNANLIYEYTLSTPFDPSTASASPATYNTATSDSLNSSSNESSAMISKNGKHMYYLFGGGFVAYYILGTAFDISTLSYQGVSSNAITILDGEGFDVTGSTSLVYGYFSDSVHRLFLADKKLNEPRIFRFNTGTPIDIKDVAYGSPYAAVGSDGAVYSSDAIQWGTADLGNSATWASVCWFSLISKFVAVAPSGTGNLTATSSDGETWTEQTQTVGFNAVAASPTACIMVGTNGIKRTTDGTSFTSITEPADRNWTGVTYSSDRARWVMVCNDGTDNRAAYSDDDGLTWTLATTPADYNWNSVEYGAGYFVAVADTGTGQRIMRSQFGVTWELVDSPADNGWNDLAWSGESLCLFAAVGDSGTGNRAMISAKDSNAASATSGDAFGFASSAREPEIMLDVHGCANRVPDVTQQWRSMGLEGEHCKRVIWRRIGQHRTFTPRFTISAPVKRVVIDATARISFDG